MDDGPRTMDDGRRTDDDGPRTMTTGLGLSAGARESVEELYRRRTPRSAQAMEQARRYMVRGLTRGWGYHRPYPIVGARGEGPELIDLDGNRYVDLVNNGLSLIHGHAFPPVVEALHAALERGSGWLVASEDQIAFARALCERIAAFERVRFTNSGTESGMLWAEGSPIIGEEIRKSALARLHATGMFHTTAMRSSALTSWSCGCDSIGSHRKMSRSMSPSAIRPPIC